MEDRVLDIGNVIERFKLEGRVAYVNGAAQGIGRAFAHALSEAGAKVAIIDINKEKAEEVAQEIADKGGESISLGADITDETAVDTAIKSITGKWGKLTIAVNNAGIGEWCNSEESTKDSWDKIININLTGVFLCCRRACQSMLDNGYGKIINTASMSAHIVNMPQNQAAYNTSKAGVVHLTRSLATEWAAKGIRVNSISPGYTRTKLVDDLLQTPLGKEVMPVWMERTPMGRMLDVTDLQGAVVFLAGALSDFMTGSDLLIDAGYCSW
jgi:NAD(P)-dependent dehydrogenase (short-subunit alcohol dehydrogenase family)